MKISCNQCGKFLFNSESETTGGAGVEAQQKGFIYKIPFLFTDKYVSLFFCNRDCGKEFYKNNIPENAEATKALKEFKAKIPKISKEIAININELIKKLK